jgi:hypothetical protein
VWKFLRISVLLVVLLVVAANAWLDRAITTSWDKTLWVGVFPMNADGSEAAERYVRGLKAEDFASVEEFFAREIRRHGIEMDRPVRMELYPSPKRLPPALAADANPLQTAWWSLKMRLFASSAADVPGRVPSYIRVFVLYHDPETTQSVPHSLGLQKGLIGLVHAYAARSMASSNNIVIAHETLHTLGATDKYDLTSGAPVFPTGFAEPERTPRYPQRFAEIMAGRRALSAREHEMPGSLREVVVGDATAAEIGWTRE